MSTVIYGDRIGTTSDLVVACDGVIFDRSKDKVLLTQTRDNGQCCLPGGRMELGMTYVLEATFSNPSDCRIPDDAGSCLLRNRKCKQVPQQYRINGATMFLFPQKKYQPGKSETREQSSNIPPQTGSA